MNFFRHSSLSKVCPSCIYLFLSANLFHLAHLTTFHCNIDAINCRLTIFSTKFTTFARISTSVLSTPTNTHNICICLLHFYGLINCVKSFCFLDKRKAFKNNEKRTHMQNNNKTKAKLTSERYRATRGGERGLLCM